LAGFNRDFRFTGQKYICPAFKDERRTDSNTENPTIKKQTNPDIKTQALAIFCR
jgi:hypothetical protein